MSATIAAPTTLNGYSWFGLVVYFTVMGLIIRGVHIPIPFFLSRPARALLQFLRILDPRSERSPTVYDVATPRTASKSRASVSAVTEVGLERTPSNASSLRPTPSHLSSTRPSLRSRSESKIGFAAQEEDTTPIASEYDAEVEVSWTGPPPEKRVRFPLDLRTAPVIGVLLLLATTTIDESVLRLGIVGEDGVQPYDVLVLFISLAYISTALDATGGLRALAFWIAQKAARAPKKGSLSTERMASGPRLYLMLYTFWFTSGVLVGNDPIVLSGTAFLGYFTRVTGITVPTAWIFSQFIAANIASAVLVSSNPTNVLITGAFKLNFLTGYTAFTLLPSVVTALVAFPLTYYTFTYSTPRSRDISHPAQAYIPASLLPPDVNPRSAILDPAGAIFHTTLMAVTLIVLIGTSFVAGGAVQVWMVTAPAGIIALLRDIWSERNYRPTSSTPIDDAGSVIEMVDALQAKPPSIVVPRRRISLPTFLHYLQSRFPTTSNTVNHLPLSLLPFAGGIFILARALTALGWTSIFAGWLAKICINPAATIFFLGYFIALVLCPLCGTNIGATILLVEILRDSNFTGAAQVLADPRILKGAIFSTALASNLGAFSWTFSSSLAGLLWVSILKQKGIHVSGKEFAGWNLAFLPILSTVSSGIILLETYYF